MNVKGATLSVFVSLIALGTVFVSASPALAHEDRKVGKYDFAVGFGDEPVYTGEKNSVQLLLSDANGPVVDLGDTLKVSVEFAGLTKDLALEPDFEIGEFGTPGDYRAWFIPTRPGKYTFHFTGSIEGQDVDEKFTSSPTGFDEAVTPTTAEFPVKDPTNAELAAALEHNASLASDASSSAKSLAIAGIVVGGLGLIVAIAALVRKGKKV